MAPFLNERLSRSLLSIFLQLIPHQVSTLQHIAYFASWSVHILCIVERTLITCSMNKILLIVCLSIYLFFCKRYAFCYVFLPPPGFKSTPTERTDKCIYQGIFFLPVPPIALLIFLHTNTSLKHILDIQKYRNIYMSKPP